MPSEIKFDRKAKVSFNNGKFIEGLRMVFRVERIAGDAFSKLKLDIYNVILQKEGEDAFFQEGDKIVLDVGYSDNISTLFTGTIRNIQDIRDGVDKITTIFAADLNGSQEPIINVTYRKQTSLISLISDLAFEADIGIAEISVKPNNLKSSLTYSKKFSDILNDLASTYNFSWYIYNFELYLYDNDTGNTGKGILQINAKTGLLETPILTQKGIDVKMLLEPSVKPKDRYEVQSGGLQFSQGNLELVEGLTQSKGLQTVLSLVHTGDTHGTSWFTEIEGIKAI